MATLIFLDIDGVLISDIFLKHRIPGSELLRFDPVCLEALEDVLRIYKDAKVVITSSWREWYPPEVFPPLFSPDIAPRVIGVTPFLKAMEIDSTAYPRYMEVLKYLQQNNLSDSPWVAIDDLIDHYPKDINLILTNSYQGFDRENADKLSQFLNNEGSLAIN
jgi:hypothetical protein